jgi:hypothetical protein
MESGNLMINMSEGLMFNVFEHSSNENCSISAVNASHFLPCDFLNKILLSASRHCSGSSLQEVNFSENIAK